MNIDFRNLLVRGESRPLGYVGHFHQFKISDRFALSIQASNSHYSDPREDFDTAKEYSAFEMAIFENNDWVSIDECADLTAFPRWNELVKTADGYLPPEERDEEYMQFGNSIVFAFVEADLIQDLITYLADVK